MHQVHDDEQRRWISVVLLALEAGVAGTPPRRRLTYHLPFEKKFRLSTKAFIANETYIFRRFYVCISVDSIVVVLLKLRRADRKVSCVEATQEGLYMQPVSGCQPPAPCVYSKFRRLRFF